MHLSYLVFLLPVHGGGGSPRPPPEPRPRGPEDEPVGPDSEEDEHEPEPPLAPDANPIDPRILHTLSEED